MYGILLEASNFRQLSQKVGHTISTCSQHLCGMFLKKIYSFCIRTFAVPDPVAGFAESGSNPIQSGSRVKDKE
jgi:hypothetical protein